MSTGLRDQKPQPNVPQGLTSIQGHEYRLSLPFPARILLGGCAAFVAGFSLGASRGGAMAGLRFQAEHAHVLPTNNQDWYFYHKSKNYNVMLNGIKTGLRMGTKICFWGTTFLVVEQGTDHLRGTADFMSTGWAGLMISGAFSAWNKFPSHTAARTLKTGLFSGLAFGLAQDALGLLRGRRLGYVDFLMGREHHADPILGGQGV